MQDIYHDSIELLDELNICFAKGIFFWLVAMYVMMLIYFSSCLKVNTFGGHLLEFVRCTKKVFCTHPHLKNLRLWLPSQLVRAKMLANFALSVSKQNYKT